MNTSIVQVFINWNEYRNSIDSLINARKNNPSSWPIIIIDNHSSDDSVEHILSFISSDSYLKRSAPEVHDRIGIYRIRTHVFKGNGEIVLIESSQNLGVSGAWNLAIEWAKKYYGFDYIFIFDNESRLNPKTIPCCLSLAQSLKIGLVGCLVKNADESIQFMGKSFYKNIFYIDVLLPHNNAPSPRGYWDVDLISGCGMLISKELLDQLLRSRGFYFDPDYFYLAEDQEFSLASKELGYRVIITRDAFVHHTTNRKKVGLSTAYYYSSRNRAYLANSYLPLHLKTLFHVYYPIYRISRALFHIFKGDALVGVSHIHGLIDAYLKKRGPLIVSKKEKDYIN